jgi:hypothetical protein
MTLKIDHLKAEKILYSEFSKVTTGLTDQLTEYWKSKVDKLGELCPYRKSSTFIAALGTAILAKTVEIKVDTYCLLDRDGGERSYSARSLADNVWAKHRGYLGIDLGANNANPLNNTPFVGRGRIDQIENVRNKEGFLYLRECLDELNKVNTEIIARAALRGFIYSRKQIPKSVFNVGQDSGDYLVIQSLIDIIKSFIQQDSEEGRRAQAVAAGLLAIAFGEENVDVGHVNDPDRNFPLDIAVYIDGDKNQIRFAIEVKDKKICGSDILSSVDKAIKYGIQNVLYLAIGPQQKSIDFTRETERARDSNCRLIIFNTWEEFCKMCLCVTLDTGPSVYGSSYRNIGKKLVEIGVSQKGLTNWLSFSSISSMKN